MSDGLWHAEPAMPRTPRLPRVLAEFTRRRTWGELLYALVGLPLAIFGFVFTVVTLSVGAGLLVTFIGLPLLAATGLVSRWFGTGIRHGANLLIGTDVAAPPRFRPRAGLFGWLGSCLSDGTAWRARLYLLAKLPAGIAGFVVAAAFYGYGLAGLTYPVWRFWTCNTSSDGTCHRGIGGGQHFFDGPISVAAVALIGAGILLAGPWAVRGVLQLDRLLVRSLLGPTRRGERVAELERTRAVAVDDSAATLRRIERDLHDGAQARLVALAMNVGLAREKLAEGGDPAEASRLLDTAHLTAKQAISELRDLARGIHPPVLDAGLDAALATLAAHSAVPVQVCTTISERPDPSIETMAYFCAAELLANAAKHSGATLLTVDARTIGGQLRLTVGDNGHGGARLGAGSGLTGLGERVGTVDGRLEVDSPVGGPTNVGIVVPLHAGRPMS